MFPYELSGHIQSLVYVSKGDDLSIPTGMFIYGLTDISIQLDMDEYLLYNLDNDSVEILDDEFIDLRLPFYNKLKEKLEKFYNSYKENRTSIQ